MVSNPIQVTNYENPIETTRKKLLDDENEKIQGNRGFIFKGYKTEKERIEEYMKNKNFYFHSLNESQLNYSHSKIENLNNTSGIKQPNMRFKPRTDLERIYETINQNTYNRADKNILDKQLRDLDLNVTKVHSKREEEIIPDYKDSSNYIYMRTIPNFENGDDSRQNITKRPKVNKNKSNKIKNLYNKKKEINSEARNLIKDFYIKTHFKGATVIASQGKGI